MDFQVIEANQRVHAALLKAGHYQQSPHRRPESKARVSAQLQQIADTNDDSLQMLDVGCGDGFMFECTPSNWQRHGIDMTPEMLAACQTNHPDVQLQQAPAEALPFLDHSFDLVTCYSFLDHLPSPEKFYAEALRVLKPGGKFYFGLNPNRSFTQSLKLLSSLDAYNRSDRIDLELEYKKAFDDGSYYETAFGINKTDLERCEPGKTIQQGMSAVDELYKLNLLGASECKLVFEWIAQQNKLSIQEVDLIRSLLPASSGCFKYFDLIGKK